MHYEVVDAGSPGEGCAANDNLIFEKLDFNISKVPQTIFPMRSIYSVLVPRCNTGIPFFFFLFFFFLVCTGSFNESSVCF